jgi:hypothetical protein
MVFCTRCGRPADPATQFCTGCGERIRPSDPPAPAPDHAPRPDPPRRGVPRWAIVTGVPVVLALCGAAVALLVIHTSPGHHVTLSPGTSPAAATSATSPPSASPQQPTTQPPTTGPPAEQVAAQDLSQMLAASAADRSAINSAYNDVEACGPRLAGDAQTFQKAASSRENLLSQLQALPDGSALPTQLIQDLSGAWQSSYQVDQDYAGWADDESSNGCTNVTSDSHYQAATNLNNQATTDKTAFVNLWNPIASQYGMATYQQGGI